MTRSPTRPVARGIRHWMHVGRRISTHSLVLFAGAFVCIASIATGEAITSNAIWEPIDYPVFTKPASILDWSGMNPVPAGNRGPLVIRAGHFEERDQPGKPLRLIGANLCDLANYQDKEAATRLADQLARLGHNAARIHHYDLHLVRKGEPLRTGWDAENLDRLDFLFSALKARGLWITIDLYTLRRVLASELTGVEENPSPDDTRSLNPTAGARGADKAVGPDDTRSLNPTAGARGADKAVGPDDFKALVAVSPSARSNWKSFAERLLTHVNPYTGLAWGRDPALFAICLVNENNTVALDGKFFIEPFKKWLSRNGEAPVAGDAKNHPRWTRFLIETHKEMVEDLSTFVRSLGVKAALTDANYRSEVPLALIREKLDCVDTHGYFDKNVVLNPTNKWQLPYGFSQTSVLKSGVPLPAALLQSRILGLPFIITEYNFCYPNHSRAAGGAALGAIAALQGWDALFRFSYAHKASNTQMSTPIIYLENVSDPINMLADRMATLLFRRGDFPASEALMAFLYSEKALDQPDAMGVGNSRQSPNYNRLSLLARTGLGRARDIKNRKEVNVAIVNRMYGQSEEGLPQLGMPVVSDGNALFTNLGGAGLLEGCRTTTYPQAGLMQNRSGTFAYDDRAGLLRLVSPRTECLAFQEGGAFRGQALRVENEAGFGVVCVSAMDGENIPESKRLLIFHLTDVLNNETEFGDTNHTKLLQWGRMPLLVRGAKASVNLQVGSRSKIRVFGLRLDGERSREIDVKRSGNAFSFTSDTRESMLYEVAME